MRREKTMLLSLKSKPVRKIIFKYFLFARRNRIVKCGWNENYAEDFANNRKSKYSYLKKNVKQRHMYFK